MENLAQKIKKLLQQQRLGALGTHGKNEPYQSLVAFTVCNGLKNIVFATEKNTRKYHNIKENPNVALLVDNRLNKRDDFYKTTAITVMGIARETMGRERKKLLAVHAARHSVIKDFFRREGCALFKIDVKVYYLVSHFQTVETLFV